MKIIRLEAENVKRLKAVSITPAGDIVEIAGENGAGKSSVLDSIMYALAGGDSLPSQPIRKGAEKAVIKLDLGDIKVTRRFNAKGSDVIVEEASGARFPSPQKMLDGLIGAISFDPMAFTREKPKDQFEALRKIANVGPEIDALDGLNKADYEKRTEANRKAKEQRAAAATIVVPDDLPDQPVDEQALLQAMQDAGEKNAELEQRKARREAAEREMETLERSAADLDCDARKMQRLMEEATAAADKALAAAAEIRKQLTTAEPLPDKIDVTAIRVQLDQAQTVNSQVRRAQAKKASEAAADEAAAAADALTATMDARAAEKAKIIAAASYPVPGLSLGDGIVLFNGLPFDQASTAEQIKVSTAIAMAGNPKLRVIRITDGSLLGKAAMQTLAEMAVANDFQIWIERVGEGGKMAVVIEDGMVRTPEDNNGTLDLLTSGE